MKILAIRGEGLASLSQRFEVALDAPPLRDAGVFAIVGPTGSGKSTLLDALCLALFDRTPRLPGRGVRIGPEDDERERIASGDPRNMLRKGAGRGWAEVDFRGIDGRAWRARWEVRRARQRSDGRLQDTALTLIDLESGRAEGGHRKGEVLAAIEARLGLSFAQFQRAVLLAQGRFAAFLDADDRERAELLERMTGTEIYGRISIEVARRAREEKLALERLDDQLVVLALLAPEERAAHERDVPARKLEVARAAQRASALDAQLRWYAERDVILREQSEIEREIRELDAQLDLAEAKRREIEEARAAEPVRARVEARDAASASLTLRRAAHEHAEAELARAESARRLAEQAADASLANEEIAARARAALEPLLRDVRALDRELAIAHERARARDQAAEEATTTSAARADEQAQLESRVAVLERAASEARARRAAHGALDSIGDEDVPRVLERLERLVATSDALAATERQRRAAEAVLAPGEETARGAAAAVERHERDLAESERRAAERRAALGRALAGEVLRAALEQLGGTRDALAVSLQAARSARGAGAREQAHRDALERAQSELAAAGARHEQATRAGERARDVLLEAERARDLARAMLDLAHLRADLRDGEACPLCGALEHPSVHDVPARLLPAQEARVSELRAAVSSHERDAARADAELVAEQRAIEHAMRERAAAASETEAESARASAAGEEAAARLDAWWCAASSELRALVLGASCEPTQRPRSWYVRFDEPALEALAAEIEAARARVLAALADREALERALDGASVELERTRAALATAAHEARDVDAALERSRARVAQLARDLERLTSDREQLLAKLEPWRAILEAHAGPLSCLDVDGAARIATALEVCARARRNESIAQASLASSEAALESTRVALDRARAVEERAAAARDEARRMLASLQARRGALLEGDADHAEAHAREAVEHASSERSSAARALATAESEALGAARLLEHSQRAVEEAERTDGDARARLAEALRAAALDEETARRGLARGPAEIGAWRRELEQLDASRASQRAVLAERARRRTAHEAAPPDGLLAREALEPEQVRARASEAAAHKLLASLEERLARDDRMREERGAVEAAITVQRGRVRTWSELEPLIGSTDGKRFRVFAQGLTLELLLDHANVQLERLAPRYALRRAPGTELAVQVVDREMGEEIRGIKSLSGGETFLVSLALALALASVTARRVPVHSLFIDEGFGGLDAESLEIALAALDALQATGRQVGVVSHVAALSERFAARIELRPRGNAESTVAVISG